MCLATSAPHDAPALLLWLLPVHHMHHQGRYVSILKVKGKLTCIDSICFHAGGPLVSTSSSTVLEQLHSTRPAKMKLNMLLVV
jgi:hypothetical protein